MAFEVTGRFRCISRYPINPKVFGESISAAIKRLNWIEYARKDSRQTVKAKSDPLWRELLIYYPSCRGHSLDASWWDTGMQLVITIKPISGSWSSDVTNQYRKLNEILQVFVSEAGSRVPLLLWQFFDMNQWAKEGHKELSPYWRPL